MHLITVHMYFTEVCASTCLVFQRVDEVRSSDSTTRSHDSVRASDQVCRLPRLELSSPVFLDLSTMSYSLDDSDDDLDVYANGNHAARGNRYADSNPYGGPTRSNNASYGGPSSRHYYDGSEQSQNPAAYDAKGPEMAYSDSVDMLGYRCAASLSYPLVRELIVRPVTSCHHDRPSSRTERARRSTSQACSLSTLVYRSLTRVPYQLERPLRPRRHPLHPPGASMTTMTNNWLRNRGHRGP